MRKGILLLLLLLIVLTGCQKENNWGYEKKVTKQYPLISDHLSIEISLFNTIVEIKTHDKKEMIVDFAYDDDNVYQAINLSYREDNLIIDLPTNSMAVSKKANSYLRLTLPNKLANLAVNVKSVEANSHFSGVEYQDFKHLQRQGKIMIENSKITNLETLLTKGEIIYKGLSSNNIYSSINSGKTQLVKVNVKEQLQVFNSHGDIALKEINQAEAKEVSIFVNNSFGELKLQDVYGKSIDLYAENGNIEYINQDKQYYIDNVTYYVTNGTSFFDIHGKIKEK